MLKKRIKIVDIQRNIFGLRGKVSIFRNKIFEAAFSINRAQLRPIYRECSLKYFIAKYRNLAPQAKYVALNINDLDAFLQHEGIPSILQEERESDTNPIASNQENESLPQKRQRMILEALSGDNGYANIKELPTGAKRKLKDELLKDHPKIFTDSTFDKSWTETSAQGLIGLAEKEKFTPKSNTKG